jgi:hypothetical protein
MRRSSPGAAIVMFCMSGAAMAPRSMSKNSLLLLGVLALVHPVIADEVPQFDI